MSTDAIAQPLVTPASRMFATITQLVWRWNLASIAVLSICTVLTFTAEHWWLADLMANLRMQWVIGLLITALVTCAFRHWRLLIVPLLCLACHFPWMMPGIVSQTAPTSSPVITVTTANVYTSNRRYPDIERELLASNADVIAVIELSHGLRDHLAGSFADKYPYSRFHARDDGNFGIGLYSQHPWSSALITYFNDENLPSVTATVQCGPHVVHVIATHTLPPMGPRAFRHRNKHLNMLASTVNSLRLKQPEIPVIVMGDLNLTPWSPLFQKFGDSAKLSRAGEGNGVTPTWYRFPIFPFGLVLDHVLTTSDLKCLAHDIGRDVGSDHRFVTARFSLAD